MTNWSLTLKLKGVRPLDPTEAPPRVVAQPLQRHRIVPRARGFRTARVARAERIGDGGDDPPPRRHGPPRRLPDPARATRRLP